MLVLVMMKGEERKNGGGERGYVLLGTHPAALSTYRPFAHGQSRRCRVHSDAYRYALRRSTLVV